MVHFLSDKNNTLPIFFYIIIVIVVIIITFLVSIQFQIQVPKQIKPFFEQINWVLSVPEASGNTGWVFTLSISATSLSGSDIYLSHCKFTLANENIWSDIKTVPFVKAMNAVMV